MGISSRHQLSRVHFPQTFLCPPPEHPCMWVGWGEGVKDMGNELWRFQNPKAPEISLELKPCISRMVATLDTQKKE